MLVIQLIQLISEHIGITLKNSASFQELIFFFLFNYICFGHEVCTELQDAIWSPSWIKTIALWNEAYTKQYTSSSILTIWNDKIRLLGKIFFPIFLTVSNLVGAHIFLHNLHDVNNTLSIKGHNNVFD